MKNQIENGLERTEQRLNNLIQMFKFILKPQTNMSSRTSAQHKPLQYSLTIEQFIAIAVFLVTFGVSIYSLVKTLPKIDELNSQIGTLNTKQAVIETKIEDLRDVLSLFPQQESNNSKDISTQK